MTLKKFLVSALSGAIILMAVPVAHTGMEISTSVEAAKGGAKMSTSKPSPKVDIKKTPSSQSAAPSTSSQSKSVSGGGKEYKPSKQAKDLPSEAPSKANSSPGQVKDTPSNAPAKANSNPAMNNNTSSTGFGNTLKNIGLFAGGMMIGSLIGSMFDGFGGGMFGDVLGLLVNLIMLYALYRGGRYLWNRYRSNKREEKTLPVEDKQPIDITPPQAMNYPNQSSMGTDYEPKRTANYYRSL